MTKRTLVFRGEAWAPANDEEGEELVPSHVNYVWTEDDEFYYANVKENFDRAIPLDQLKGKHIPKERVYARIDPGLTIAPEPLPRDVHMKTLTFAFTDEDAEKHTCMGDALLAEAKVYEILKQHPHPNIARYYGCVSKSGYLTGLALKKYKKSLADLVREGYGFTKDEITQLVDTLHSAVRHLHALGLAHNDLNPANIMLDEHNSLVLIDLDSCAPFGKELIKFGTPGWTTEKDWMISSGRNDEHALKCIELYLRGEYNPSDHIE